MNHEAPTGLSASHRTGKSQTHSLASKTPVARVLVSLGALAGLWLLGACAVPGISQSSGSRTCPDKFVQSIETNQPVKGLWACLNSTLQNNLNATGQTPGDGAFTSPGVSAPPVLTTHHVGSANGVDVYTILIQPASGPLTIYVVAVWSDASGKISNVAVTSGIF